MQKLTKKQLLKQLQRMKGSQGLSLAARDKKISLPKAPWEEEIEEGKDDEAQE